MVEPDEPSMLASQLRTCVGRLRRRLAAERGRDAPSMGEISVLCALDRFGSLSIGELAAREQVRPPSMTRCVDSLERRGCVRRSARPGDRRVTLIELTVSGRELVLADREARDAWLACRLQALSEEQRELLARAVPTLELLCAPAGQELSA